MYALIWTEQFSRAVKKFIRKQPELKSGLAETLSDLEKDPMKPNLKLHALSGQLKGMHALSLTYSYRITLTIKIVEGEIILIDIGSHDDLYRR